MTKQTIRLLSILICIAAVSLLSGCSRTSPERAPEKAIVLTSPSMNRAIAWTDDSDTSKFGFQLAVKGLIEGFSNIQNFSVKLQIDGKPTETTATTSGFAFEFSPVTLEIGAHELAVTAEVGSKTLSLSKTIIIPELPEGMRPAVSIIDPDDLKSYQIEEDTDASTPGFQILVSGTLMNLIGTAGEVPQISVSIDSLPADPAPQVEIKESNLSDNTFKFAVPDLTVPVGLHAVQISAVLGTQTASDTVYVLIPNPDSDQTFSLTIHDPANQTVFSAEDDLDANTAGFQTNVSGELRGFSSDAVLTIQRNGMPLTPNAPSLNVENGRFDFLGVTLPEGRNILNVTASQLVNGDLIERNTYVTVTVPKLSGDAEISISAPADASVLSWAADLDPEREGYQLNISGTISGSQTAAGGLKLFIDGSLADIAADITETQISEEGTSESPLLHFSFNGVTLEPGIHLITVSSTVNGEVISDQIYVAVQDPLPANPSAEIIVPMDGAGISISTAGGTAGIEVSGVLENASSAVLYVDGAALNDLPVIAEDGTFTFSNIQLSEGRHVLQVQVSSDRYTGLSAAVSVQVAFFSLDVLWPADGAVIYLNEDDSAAHEELIGKITGCSGCRGIPSVTYKVGADGIPIPLAVSSGQIFRQIADLTGTGSVNLIFTAQQTLDEADASEASASFSAERIVTINLREASEKPAAEISITYPPNGSVLGWRDNQDLASESLITSVNAEVSGLHLGDALYQLYVDGVLLEESGTSSKCALTTSGTSVTAFSCSGIDLGGEGLHIIRASAILKNSGAEAESHSAVTVNSTASPSTEAAKIAITSPADGSTLSWVNDASGNEGYQAVISGRLAGFDGAQLPEVSVYVDGVQSSSSCSVSGTSFTCGSVTLTSDIHTVTVQAIGTSAAGLMLAPSDAISVMVPDAPTLSIEAVRAEDGASTILSAMSSGFTAEASFLLETYVDGALASSGIRDISELTLGIEVQDSELELLPVPACHSVFFVLTGTEGANSHTTAISKLLRIGSDCSVGPSVPLTLIITSPKSGDVISISSSSSAPVTVSGVVVAENLALTPALFIGGIPCSYSETSRTFSCSAEFEAGEHVLTVRDQSYNVSSGSISITVKNITGCPITLGNTGIAADADGRHVFNRSSPGLTLTNSAAGTTGSFTFSGSVPAECAGGTVSVLKKLSDGTYESEAKTANILADGTFAYRAVLNDGEDGSELVFTASKPFFAAAASASYAYIADFTVPTLTPSEADTFDLSNQTAAATILHERDLREGLKATVTTENDEALGTFDVTFTVKGLSADAATPDTVTFSYDGSDIPILIDQLHPAEGASQATFTRSIALPGGDWQLTIKLTDGSGNTSSQAFPLHVDLGCGVALTSHISGGIAVLPFDESGVVPSELVLSGTSFCAGTIYALSSGGSDIGTCDASATDGSFHCSAEISQNTTVSLTAPDGSVQTLSVRLINNDPAIDLQSPLTSAGGLMVVSGDNTHCPEGICPAGFIRDLDTSSETGSFDLRLLAETDEGKVLTCSFYLDDEILDIPCVISDDGKIDQRISLAQGTLGVFTVQIEKTAAGETGIPPEMSSASFGVAVGSETPAAPVVILPGADGASVVDCGNAQDVTCISNRHQGIIDIWMNAAADGITRTRGYVTGTKVSLSNAADNTEAFNESTFTDGVLMTWFSAAKTDDGKEHSVISVAPMNLLHLGVRDVDSFGNRSPVTLVKNIDMFWNHFSRNFASENEESSLGISLDKGFSFGQLSAVGDFNGDGVDDAVVTGGTYTSGIAVMTVYYGSKGTGLTPQNRDTFKTSYVSALTSVDINHDGYDDVVSIHYDSAAFKYYAAIHFGSGAGLSSAEKRIAIDYKFTAYGSEFETGFLNVRTVDDLNGDGFSDLVFSESLTGIYNPLTSTYQANLFILLTGSALNAKLNAEEQPYLSSLASWQINGGENESLGAGLDLDVWNIFSIPDGNNAPALLVGAPGAKKAYLFRLADLENCLPTVGCDAADAAAQIIEVPQDHLNTHFGRTIAVLDGNNDGVPDIYFGMATASSEITNQDNSIHVSTGSLSAEGISFSAPVQFNRARSSLTKNFFAKNIRQANLLGDGYLSLIANTNSTVANRAYIYWNSAASGLSPEYGSIIEGPAGFGATIEMGDFNGDGQLDILFGTPNPSGHASADPNGEFHVYY